MRAGELNYQHYSTGSILLVAFARKSLAARREAAHLTQEKLANRAGVTVGTVAKLEQGREVNPRLRTCEKLAEALSCHVCDLIVTAEQSRPQRAKRQS